jgi:MOSC domain-containing protein YiiM
MARRDRAHRCLEGAATGPVMARRLNLDGDGQGDTAGHGGEQRAVLVYQVSSYEHWRRHFGRDDLGYGIFRPGFYMRVITEGRIEAGDAIVKTRGGPGSLSVADTDTLLYLPGRDRAKLRTAAVIPALSPGWQPHAHAHEHVFYSAATPAERQGAGAAAGRLTGEALARPAVTSPRLL